MSKPRAIQEWEYGNLGWDEWVAEYKPGDMLETYGEEYHKVLDMVALEPGRVWTLLDCDGKTVIVSGWAYINRLGYYLTEVSVPDMVSIEVEDY